MRMLKNTQSGFTLIELLVVVIIVAVLAVVGIPLMQGNVERARMTEADAALGTIRTAMRAEQAENAGFPVIASGTTAVAAAIGINANDLTGRFFEDDDFTFSGATTATTYCASVTGDTAGTAPRGNQVNGLTRSMNQDGNIFSTANCSGTPLN